MADCTCFLLLQIVGSTLKLQITYSCDIFQDSKHGNTMYSVSEIFLSKFFYALSIEKIKLVYCFVLQSNSSSCNYCSVCSC